MKFTHHRLPDNVLAARQAFSLDDCRETFRPIPWEPPANPQGISPLPARLRQVWFAGVHANVGGGYADDRLAYLPLAWMLAEAKAAGLAFDTADETEINALADINGKLYDSRAGAGLFYRYRPRSLAVLMQNTGATPLVHDSALARIAYGSDTYGPIAIDTAYDVLAANGTISAGTPVTGQPQFDAALARAWWRRVLYFATLAVLLLLAMPPLWPGFPLTGLLAAPDAILAGIMRSVAQTLPLGSLLPNGLGSAGTMWYAAAEQAPATGVLLLLLFGLLRAVDAALASGIDTAAATAWVAVLVPPPVATPLVPTPWWLRFADACRNSAKLVATWRFLSGTALPLLLTVAVLGSIAAFVVLPIVAQGVFLVRAERGEVCIPTLHPNADRFGQPLDFDIAQPCWASGLVLAKGERYRITLSIPPGQDWFDHSIATDLGGYDGHELQHHLFALAKRWWGQPWFQPVARFGATGGSERPLVPLDPFPARQPLRPTDQALYDARVKDAKPDPAAPPTPAAQGMCSALNWLMSSTAGFGPWDRLPDGDAGYLARLDQNANAARTHMIAEVTATKSGELFLYVNDAIPLPCSDFYRNNRGMARVWVVPAP
jgi:hypothetical protein